jgi:lysophospholipase L1-like esterase
MFAARGAADFTRLVAIGDSYGAGYENGAVSQEHQPYSWPAVLARQVGLTICPPTATATDNCFAVPYISYPGLGSSSELVLNDIISYPPVITPAAGSGQPLMLTFGRPYNNLSVPGYTVGAALTLTGKEANSGLGQVILRGLGSEVDQAIALHPTFIAVWLGGNDFLGSVTSGTSAGLTSAADFKTQYEAMLDKLIAGAPSAGMVVGTLPTNPVGVPFLNTVQRVLIDPATRQPALVGGQPIPLIGDLGNGVFGPVPAGAYITLPAGSLIATGYGLPSQLAAFPPFNDKTKYPNVGKPLPGSVVLTADEISAIVARIAEYNTIITAAAQTRNIPVADIKGLFDRVASRQLFVGPFQITGDYITGGFFSLDGVHLTDLGYILFANEYIKAINGGYGTKIPVASVTQLLADNGAFFATLNGMPMFPGTPYSISSEAAAAMLQMLTLPQPAPAPRRRGTIH